MSIYSTISPLFKHFKLPRPHSHLILTRSYTHTIPYLASQNLQSPPLFFFTVFSLKTLPLPFPVSILPFRHFLPFLFRPFHFPFLPFPVSSLPDLHSFLFLFPTYQYHTSILFFNFLFCFLPLYHTSIGSLSCFLPTTPSSHSFLFLAFLFSPVCHIFIPFLPFPVSSLPQLHPFHLNTMKFNLFVFHIFLFPPVYHTFKSFILFSVSFLLTRSSFLHFPVSSIPTRPSFFPFLFTPFLPDLLSPLSCFLRFL